MPRRLHTWKIRTRELALGERTLIMGVLNVTPDSFSDGNQYLDPDRAYARAMEMEEQGADIIDVGAESTRPGSQPINAAEELRRLVPVLKRLRDQLSIPVSVDTYKAEVAERALELGVEIINDPSGFTFDPLLVKPVVEYNAGVIFNHMRGKPETWASLGPLQDVMGAIVKDLDASVNRARRAGVDMLRIVVDPGIGFGKRREQNSEILARLGEMARLDLPILVGPSRKSFLAHPSERETLFATAGAVAASVLGGAHIVRVHDIIEMKAVCAIADEVVRAMERRADQTREAEAEKPVRKAKTFVAASSPEVPAVRPPVRPPMMPKPAPTRPELPRDTAPRREFRPAARPRPVEPRESNREQRPNNFSRPPRPNDRRDGDRPEQPRPSGDRPRPFEKRPERSANGGPPRFNDRPNFRSNDRSSARSNDRPQRSSGGPPRSSDRPQRSNSGPPRSNDRPNDRPPRSNSGPPRSGPPRESSGNDRAPRDWTPRPPYRGKGPRPGGPPPRGGSRPGPRSGPPSRGPNFGKRK
jgi:dihydropteroate synthase